MDLTCKRCGCPIKSGKYCSCCKSQNNRKIGNALKTVGLVAAGIVVSILTNGKIKPKLKK